MAVKNVKVYICDRCGNSCDSAHVVDGLVKGECGKKSRLAGATKWFYIEREMADDPIEINRGVSDWATKLACSPQCCIELVAQLLEQAK